MARVREITERYWGGKTACSVSWLSSRNAVLRRFASFVTFFAPIGALALLTSIAY